MLERRIRDYASSRPAAWRSRESSLIKLIMAAEAAKAKAPPSAEELRRKELGAMKLSALKNRAVAANVTAEQLDAAFDAEDIKTTVVNLIVAASL